MSAHFDVMPTWSFKVPGLTTSGFSFGVGNERDLSLSFYRALESINFGFLLLLFHFLRRPCAKIKSPAATDSATARTDSFFMRTLNFLKAEWDLLRFRREGRCRLLFPCQGKSEEDSCLHDQPYGAT